MGGRISSRINVYEFNNINNPSLAKPNLTVQIQV